MSIDKVVPGQSLMRRSARMLNNQVDVTNREILYNGIPLSPTGAKVKTSSTYGDYDRNIVDVQNLSGANRIRGEFLRLSSSLIVHDDDKYGPEGLIFEGRNPGSLFFGKIVCLLEDCVHGDIVKAQLSGACYARMTVFNIDDEHAIVAGNVKATSHNFGQMEILGTPATGPDQMVPVYLNGQLSGWFVAKSGALGIAAATDAGGVRTAGTGVAELHRRDDAGDLIPINALPQLYQINNFTDDVCPGDTWIGVTVDKFGKLWWTEIDCPPEAG